METQLLSQLYNAIIAGIIIVIGGGAALIVALFKWLPQYIKARQEQVLADQAALREEKREQGDTTRESEHAESRLKLASASILESQARNFEAQATMWQHILQEFKETRNTTEAHTIAVSNTSHTVEAHGRQITGLTEAVGELREKIEATSTSIATVLDKLPTQQKTEQIDQSITTLVDIARNVTVAQVDLNLLLNKANDLLIKLTLKKTDSQPITLPEITDGKLRNVTNLTD